MTGTSYLANKIKRALERDGSNLKHNSFHTILSAIEDLPPLCVLHIQTSLNTTGSQPLTWLALKAFINNHCPGEKIYKEKFYEHFQDIRQQLNKSNNAKFRQYICHLKRAGYIDTTHRYVIVKQSIPIDLKSIRYPRVL